MEVDIQEMWSQARTVLMELGTEFGLKIVAALAVFLIGRWAARLVSNGVKKLMHNNDVEDTLETFVGNLLYIVLLTLVIVASVGTLGVQVASFVAILGAAGLAVGLALQGSLSNFAAGVLIILFKPYRVGDYIEAAGVGGSVKSLQIFTTILTTPDNKQVIVPNSQITDGVITNYSAMETRRIDLVIGVGYGDDLDKVHGILNDIVGGHDKILDEPAPQIAVLELADSSVNFAVRPWVASGDYWPVRLELTEAIKKRFDEAGVSIPFPQRDVHVHQVSTA